MFDEREFLDVAHHLQSADAREGFQRSAISRAYYATFLFASRICRERGWIGHVGSGADHRSIADAIARLDRRLGREFGELQQLRRDADYTEGEFGQGRMADNAQLATDLAEFIRSELQRFR